MNLKEIKQVIEDHKITLSIPKEKGSYPIYYLFANDYHDREEIVSMLGDAGIILCFIEVSDWEGSMTPWPAESLFKKAPDFLGEADRFIEEFQQVKDFVKATLPEEIVISSSHVVGFSLSAIFSLYLVSREEGFQSVVAISPSAWYEGLFTYFRDHPMPSSLKAIYLSLGIEEADHSNEKIASVEERTLKLQELFQEQAMRVFLSCDQGDHYDLITERMVAGIQWSLLSTEMLDQ